MNLQMTQRINKHLDFVCRFIFTKRKDIILLTNLKVVVGVLLSGVS